MSQVEGAAAERAAATAAAGAATAGPPAAATIAEGQLATWLQCMVLRITRLSARVLMHITRSDVPRTSDRVRVI